MKRKHWEVVNLLFREECKWRLWARSFFQSLEAFKVPIYSALGSFIVYVCVCLCVCFLNTGLEGARGTEGRGEGRCAGLCGGTWAFTPCTWEPCRAGGREDLTWVLPWVAMGEYLDPVWLCHINGVGCPWH